MDKMTVLSKNIKLELAENDIPFETLQNIYSRFEKNGIYSVVALPANLRHSSAKSRDKSRPRMARYRRIQAEILQFFEGQIDTIWVK
jgi:hypothetical protein